MKHSASDLKTKFDYETRNAVEQKRPMQEAGEHTTIPSVERGQGAPRKVLGIMFGGRCLVKLQTIAVVKRMLAGSSEGLLT